MDIFETHANVTKDYRVYIHSFINMQDPHTHTDDIQELRRLHIELDQTVLNAYGWPDLTLGHNFVQVDTLAENDRTHFTITPEARKELLKRLLTENHKRAKSEPMVTVTPKSGKRAISSTERQRELY